jgi:hypothetical protein
MNDNSYSDLKSKTASLLESLLQEDKRTDRLFMHLDKDVTDRNKLKNIPKGNTIVKPPKDPRTKSELKKRKQLEDQKGKLPVKFKIDKDTSKVFTPEELLAIKEQLTKQIQAERVQKSHSNLKNTNVLWQPHVGFQTDFLSSTEYEVLAGGGRGSGKSTALIIDPLRFVYNKNFKGLVIRRTMPALREIISNAKSLYPKIYPGTKWKEQEKIFEFPSGATMEFGYFDHEDDYDRYHGRQFCWLGVDEITQWEDISFYDKIKSVVRKIDVSLPVRIRATCNPSGPGREWVRDYFGIESGVKDKTTNTTVTTQLGELVVGRRYILSNVFDNPTILHSNPEYIAYLESLPEVQRKQWLEGDFDANEGMAFEEFNKRVHVIEPYNIPNNWVKLRCIDWGYSSRSKAVCLWLAVTPEHDIIAYRELAVNKMLARDFALKVLELSQGEYISYSVIDGSVGDERGSNAPTIDEEMRNVGLICNYADKKANSRIHGKQLIHKYLQIDSVTTLPRLRIFNTCKQLVRELGSLQLDKHNSEDVNTGMEDHCFDDQTEVLTDNGWKLFKDLDRTEQVATLSEDYKIEYQLPSEYQVIPYKGVLNTYDNNGINFATTPNHKFCTVTQAQHKKWKTNNWTLSTLDKLSSVTWIPRVGTLHRDVTYNIKINDRYWDQENFASILGWWLSEGCTSTVQGRKFIHIDQKKHTSIIRQILAESPYNWVEHTNKQGITRFSCSNVELTTWFKEQGFFNTHSDTKVIPRWVLNTFTIKSLSSLYEAMMLGDGCRTQSCWHYDTTSKELADTFQELLVLIGKSGNLHYYTHAQQVNPKHKPTYRINIRRISDFAELHMDKVKQVDYDGVVYCLTVPKYHTLFVRRNGKIMVCGQSYDALRYGLSSRPDPTLNNSISNDYFFGTPYQSRRLTINTYPVVDSKFGY